MLTKIQINNHLYRRYADVEKISRFTSLLDESVSITDFDELDYFYVRFVTLLNFYNDDDTLKKSFIDNNTSNNELTYNDMLVHLVSLNYDFNAVKDFLKDLIDNDDLHFVDYSDLVETYDYNIDYYE